ncbi:MAG TPA: cohesin domain-containing protein [Anaerolineae bacterium]|nr:cohesin domain-containing protein [Anaerolineae bacterium]
MSIVLENAQDVYGIDVRARFDPAVIEIVDADPDSAGIQMIPGSFPQPDFLVRNTADNQAGTLQYVTTQVNPTLPVKGSGLVFSIQVRGKALGQSAVVSIEFVEIADRRGNTLPVDSLNSTVTVVSPKPPTVTPTAPPMSTVTVIDPTRASTPVTSATRVSPTRTTPATASGNRADQLPSDSVLIWVALAGFVGAGVLLAVAATVLLRRRHRTP